MLQSVQGIYRQGKVELAESPVNVPEDARVIVTFLESGIVDLRARGIDEKQAAQLRGRLETFEEEWSAPEMTLYDNYDAAKPAP